MNTPPAIGTCTYCHTVLYQDAPVIVLADGHAHIACHRFHQREH